MKTPFVWLGSGRAKKRGVARRGVLLDKVARAGLPVPDGAILLDELLRIYLQEGVVEQVGDKVVVPDAVWLLEVLYRDVRFPRLRTTADIIIIPADEMNGPLPARAAATGVDLEDAGQVAEALRKVWSYPTSDEDVRRDVLIVKQIVGQKWGTARLSADSDAVEITVRSGAEAESFNLTQLGSWQRPPADLPPYARRLQKLLRGVWRTLGSGEWLIDWVDDGEVCWAAAVYY